MKLVSWNVNGLRAVLRKNFLEFVEETQPDILCLQEIKCHPGQVDFQLDGYHRHWNPARKGGYSGTLLLSRTEPTEVTLGPGKTKEDPEGRVIAAEFDDFYLVNVYTPNSGRELARLEYRTEEWDPVFLRYIKRLEKKKPVAVCGDLNVAHEDIDLARPDANRNKTAGFTDAERDRFRKILKAGFIDTFREFCGEPGKYTFWDYRFQARAKNVGWRIDYFLISPALRPRLKSASILDHVMGSDHCPVQIELDGKG